MCSHRETDITFKGKLLILTFFAGMTALSTHQIASAHTPSLSTCSEATCNVDVLDFSFQSSAITIRPPNPDTGESVTVVWQNHGAVSHTVTSGTRGSPDGIFDQVLSSGTIFQLEINQSMYSQLLSQYPTGVVPYHCRFHLGMDATVKITGEPIPEFSLSALILTFAIIFVVLIFLKHGVPRNIGSKNATRAL